MNDRLFKPGPALRPLTHRQQQIYTLIQSVPGGVDAPELGALIHAHHRKHAPDERCEWCGQDGARALREKAIRERVVRRAGGVYEPRDPADRPGVPGSQITGPLPGSTFEDIFNRPEAA